MNVRVTVITLTATGYYETLCSGIWKIANGLMDPRDFSC